MIYLYNRAKKRRAARENALQDQQKSSEQVVTGDQQDITEVKVSEPQPTVVESGQPSDTTKATPKEDPKESPEEKRRRRIYRWKLVISLFFPAFVASVDLTIVATALTTIASHFSMICLSVTKIRF
jgi:hypothetical protein